MLSHQWVPVTSRQTSINQHGPRKNNRTNQIGFSAPQTVHKELLTKVLNREPIRNYLNPNLAPPFVNQVKAELTEQRISRLCLVILQVLQQKHQK